MDDNGMLFTVFQNRMHLARDFLGERKKSWFGVIYMSYNKQGVQENILRVLFSTPLKEGACLVSISRF